MRVNNLGDPWYMPIDEMANWESNISYGAPVDPVEVGYFQGQINKFQKAMNDVDATRQNLEMLLVADITDAQVEQIQALITEYYDKQQQFRYAADAFNAVADMVNAVGGELAPIQIPSGLGLFPALGIPAVWVAAIAGAAVLISFAVGWIQRANRTITTIAADISDPAKRDTALNSSAIIAAKTDPTAAHQMAMKINDPVYRDLTLAQVSDIAASTGGGSLFGDVSQTVKIAAIGLGALLIINMMGND